MWKKNMREPEKHLLDIIDEFSVNLKDFLCFSVNKLSACLKDKCKGYADKSKK